MSLLTTLSQVRDVVLALGGGPAYVSVFAGRIADTGVDPLPIMSAAVEMVANPSGHRVDLGQSQGVLNIVQADQIGCHIITVTSDILRNFLCSAVICWSTHWIRSGCSMGTL